jgi:hypothetical protein
VLHLCGGTVVQSAIPSNLAPWMSSKSNLYSERFTRDFRVDIDDVTLITGSLHLRR